jgi:asparagine synthase (glutamine-hydrolysing)
MCGILTALSNEPNAFSLSALRSALNILEHRGPDNIGNYSSEKIFLGHARLSIVDTSSSANQPYEYKNLILVYNGEIFNYIELRSELITHGYEFTTESDTEVVIKAFHKYGVACLEMFNGMWALAVYDRDTEEMVLSRDRFGQKPLFFAYAGGVHYAASELQSLATLVEVVPNFAAIESFLKEGDFDVDGNTFFEGIFEFPKACYARIRPGVAVEVCRYWQYPAVKQPLFTEAKDFHRLLENAVELRLRTDVNYCLLLSGGCDSTIVAGITRDIVGSTARLAAFNFSSGDKDDESQYAAEVAKELDIELYLSGQHVESGDFITRLQRLVRHLGRGHSSPAIVSIDRLYENIRNRGYKVALDGQGADELLAGYKHYHFHLMLDLFLRCEWRQIPSLLSDLRVEGVKNVLLMSLRNSVPEVCRKWFRTVYGYEKLFSNKMRRSLRPNPMQANESLCIGLGWLERYLLKQHRVGLSNLLYYGDIVAMSNSVENRSPFMDHRLVEFCFSGDFRLKVDMGRDKAALRTHTVHRRFIQVLDRKKIGFASPVMPADRKLMLEELKSSAVLDWAIFDNSRIRNFLYGGAAVSDKYERFLFRLYQVHVWKKEFMFKQTSILGDDSPVAFMPKYLPQSEISIVSNKSVE